MAKTKIGVILPSRGMMFSRTAEEILNNLEGVDHEIFFQHGEPIPDCFETPTDLALNDPAMTHLWFVEDDMILPDGTLSKLLGAHASVATLDYPVLGTGQGSVFRDPSGKVIFTGTGCLLVERGVFGRLKAPYFRTDIHWAPLNYGTAVKFLGSEQNANKGYGGHDVTFGLKLYKAGIPITVLPGKLGQRRLVALGKAGTNKGAHVITKWTKVVPDVFLKQIMSYPIAPGANTKLVTVLTPTGAISTSKSHAESLIAQKMGKLAPPAAFILDDSEVEL